MARESFTSSHMGSKRAAASMYKGLYSNILKNTRISPGASQTKHSSLLERYVKGVANHRRISILFLIAKTDGITLDQIAQALACNFKTTSEHTRRLTHAGLVSKKYLGTSVLHTLTPYGRKFYEFLRLF